MNEYIVRQLKTTLWSFTDKNLWFSWCFEHPVVSLAQVLYRKLSHLSAQQNQTATKPKMGWQGRGFCHLQVAWSLAGFQPRLGFTFCSSRAIECYPDSGADVLSSRASAKPYFVPGDPKSTAPAHTSWCVAAYGYCAPESRSQQSCLSTKSD